MSGWVRSVMIRCVCCYLKLWNCKTKKLHNLKHKIVLNAYWILQGTLSFWNDRLNYAILRRRSNLSNNCVVYKNIKIWRIILSPPAITWQLISSTRPHHKHGDKQREQSKFNIRILVVCKERRRDWQTSNWRQVIVSNHTALNFAINLAIGW